MTLPIADPTQSFSPIDPIPLAIRVGITGHRHLSPACLTSLEGNVDRALEKIRTDLFQRSRATPISLCALSALAEGADRMVTRRILATPGGRLEVVLPRDRDSYIKDFQEDHSRREFHDLLGQARSTDHAPALPTREDGYIWASHQVVKRVDVLLAVWDGQPSRGEGGTAYSICYALETCTPVLWVPTNAGDLSADEFVVDKGKGPVKTVFFNAGAERTLASGRTRSHHLPFDRTLNMIRSLDRYNKVPRLFGRRCRALRPIQVDKEIFDEPMGLADGGSDDIVRQLAECVRPYFVWADRRSLFFQRWYLRAIIGEFLAAFLAVFLAALLVIYNWSQYFFVIETVLLGLIFIMVIAGRRLEMHDQWLDCRFLAERFRSTVFLKAAGLENRRDDGVAGMNAHDSTESWLGHVYAYVSTLCPPQAVASHRVLRELLVESWIRPQTSYFSRSSEMHGTRQRQLQVLIYILFGGAFGVSIWHAVGLPKPLDKVVGVVAFALPALGSAIAGISVHLEHQRHAVVYRRVAQDLNVLGRRLIEASTWNELTTLALIAGNTMNTENRDWIGVMRCHDFEIST
jgi:hypothetical protein